MPINVKTILPDDVLRLASTQRAKATPAANANPSALSQPESAPVRPKTNNADE
jgi:hypothetical protein